jgi:8-oxo-dGTP diphosphatase
MPDAISAETNLLLVVAAAMFDGAGRVLVQQRPPGTAMAGLWEFPGGKIEPGETPEAALCRELSEELGIAVAAGDVTPMTFASEGLGARHLLLLLYRVRAWAGEPEARHATALQWVMPAELRRLAMPPADAPLIELIERLV